jgi:hypothetical protein
MTEHFAGQYLDSVDQLFQAVGWFLTDLSEGVSQTVLIEWIRRLYLCCDSDGEYVE